MSTRGAGRAAGRMVDFVNETETAGTLDVVVSFTGTGSTTRIDERMHFTDPHVMSLEGTRGWERGCAATAEFDEVTVPGELVSCSMSRVRQAEVRVFHDVPA